MNNVVIGKEKLNENMFKIPVVANRTKKVIDLCSVGLYSDTRDSLHKREIKIIQEMVLNKIIDVESYYLCENYYNGTLNKTRCSRNSRYSHHSFGGDDIEIDDLYLFTDYVQEAEHMKIAKYIVYNYLNQLYNVEWDKDSSTMYIKELNLLIANENQKISDFIYRTLNKDINFAVITQYRDNDEIRHCNKIAIRYIKPRRDILEKIYNCNTIDYSWYVNNFMDVLGRFANVLGYIDNILIKRNRDVHIEDNSKKEIKSIKSCAICANLKRYCSEYSTKRLITNDPKNFLDLATERDLCTLGNGAFDIKSNDIQCENYEEINIKCIQCGKGIKYTEFYLMDKKLCSDECKKEYDEIQAKKEDERKRREDKHKQEMIESKKRLNKRYKEIEELAKREGLNNKEVKNMKTKAKKEERLRGL